MQSGVRQRLVGAFVLICLAAILWPVLFSKNVNPVLDRRSQIPPIPAFEKYEIKEPVKPVNVSEVMHYQAESADDNLKPSSKALAEQSKTPAAAQPDASADKSLPQKPSFTEQGLPVYWALQLASFSQQDKADRLKQALLAKGYKVDMQTVKTAKGERIRVYVGPKLDKSVLEKIKPAIDKEFKVQSLLVQFSPR
ncbi:SPOR domain-containing protein [Dasania sp. GY-MA-18]|uniref:SPOR domain-containing protein n=1 Tax=Dasania phycosphaerae TaxID=2950436 RepID=A0A9J6RIS4_9GAMM|nr:MULTISPECIES: SPOR domain-containing protein [Dasania]MCR8921724.1 SPOR domain-containing protein [Dasania sp. GY-MA-18]MCZ0864152.1 SPOR domain-containing protein [Dasania phycosphaerae]MCZ0867880.1 SPOR domain-containing protein [Dasania phycosphaerae]